MAKRKIKIRRSLSSGDFRTNPKRESEHRYYPCVEMGVNEGYIDAQAIEKAFPNKEERKAYVKALIGKMEEDLPSYKVQ